MGVLLALAGAFAFALMNVFVRNGLRPGDTDNGVLTTMVVNVAMYAILIAVVVGIGGPPELDASGVAWFVAAGVSATFVGRNTLYGAIRRIGATRGAAIKNATPLVTIAIALVFLGERLTPIALVGVVLIIGALLLLIQESLRGAPGLDGTFEPASEVGDAFRAEALAETGLWDRTRVMADQTMAAIREPARRSVVIGVSLGALAALAFGSGHAFRKIGMDLLPDALVGATIGSATALVAYLLTAAVRGRAARDIRAVATESRPWFWAAGVAGTFGQLSFFAALAFAPVSHVSVVAGSETVLTVIVAALIARRLEAITIRVVIPAVLVFAGATLIAMAG